MRCADVISILLVASPCATAWTASPSLRPSARDTTAGPRYHRLLPAGPRYHYHRRFQPPLLQSVEETPPTEEADESEAAPPAAPAAPRQYDVRKLTGAGADEGGGAGFNQFDPVLSATGFISRRFGLVGGLGLVALLAAVEGKEIVAALIAPPTVEGSGELITTASGLQYRETVVARAGDSPLPGTLIGFNARVSIGDKVLLDTFAGKPVAFKYGQRPFQNVVCDGLEEGIKGMKVGGKRTLLVPQSLAPPGVTLPEGVPLTYELELTEVLQNYLQ